MRKLLASQLKPTKHISKQLFRLILSWYFFIAIALTLVQLGVEFHNEKSDLANQIDSMALTITPAISEALWNYDDDQVNASIKGFYNNPEIFGVLVRPKSAESSAYAIGEYVSSESESGEQAVAVIEADIKSSQAGLGAVLYAKDYALVSPEDQSELGSLSIYYSSQTVIERTYKTFVTTVVMAFMKTLGLWLIAVNIINRLVAKPVTQLQEEIMGFDIDKSSQGEYQRSAEHEGDSINEIQYLRECFEAFKVELQNKNFLIDKNTENLENAVVNKTQELTKALEELTRASQVKSEFLANISHELRTPLNSIIGFTNRILVKYSSNLEERIIDSIQTVNSNGVHLLSLVNDLLDIAKIEAGKMGLEIAECDLDDILGDALDVAVPMAKGKGIDIELEADATKDLVADAKRLKQVLINLLGNAIKFSDQGPIRIAVQNLALDEVQGIEFRVIDKGIGIPKENIATLFDRFAQVGGVQASTPGTGLGLAIAKELVGLHGGSIRVESEVGKGSEFIIWIPLVARS